MVDTKKLSELVELTEPSLTTMLLAWAEYARHHKTLLTQVSEHELLRGCCPRWSAILLPCLATDRLF